MKPYSSTGLTNSGRLFRTFPITLLTGYAFMPSARFFATS